MASATPPDHDALYHRLFGHPGVVAQLLRGFVDAPLLADLDLDGMERLSAKFHAVSGQRREGDMIWRIPRRHGADAYLVLLLEFQSTSDRYMALRVLTYASLLWQQLTREQRLVTHGLLPPILPVVLYNGDARWGGALSVRQLVDLPDGSRLWPWQPELRYHLIDVGAFDATELVARDGLPALWFRLENAAGPAELVAVADAVLAWLGRHPDFSAARAIFADLIGARLARLGPGSRVPEDLREARDMLATRVEQWIQGWLQTGRQEGRQEGEAALLLRLLERRFGTLPDWVEPRVRAADVAALEEWSLRLLDAETLEQVLGPI